MAAQMNGETIEFASIARDCAVVRSLQNRLVDPPTPQEKGHLFETFFYNELKRLRDYYEKPDEISFWREGKQEVDLLITGPHGPRMAFECKTSSETISEATLTAFRKRFPAVKLYVASLKDDSPRKLKDDITVLPWKRFFTTCISCPMGIGLRSFERFLKYIRPF